MRWSLLGLVTVSLVTRRRKTMVASAKEHGRWRRQCVADPAGLILGESAQGPLGTWDPGIRRRFKRTFVGNSHSVLRPPHRGDQMKFI